jgi:PAS domain-containing protein
MTPGIKVPLTRRLPASLPMRVGLVAALATLVVQAALLVLLQGSLTAAGVAALYAETANVVRATVDVRSASRAEEMQRVGNRLVLSGSISGAAIYDSAGELQLVAGEAPAVSLARVLDERRDRFPGRDGTRVDFYLPPALSETPFHIIVRRDASAVLSEARHTLLAGLAIIVAGGLAAGLFAALLAQRLASRPLARIAGTLRTAAGAPERADAAPVAASGVAEIRMLGDAADALLKASADGWRGPVAAARALLETAPVPVVLLTPEGDIASANEAAARFFGPQLQLERATTLIQVVDVETGRRTALAGVGAEPGRGMREVRIETRFGTSHAELGVTTTDTAGNEPTTVLMFFDLGARHEIETALARRAERAEQAAGDERRRGFELKLMLEGCLALMGGAEPDAAETLDPTAAILEWRDRAIEAGIARSVSLAPGAIAVAGPAGALRRIFRLALVAAYARCGGGPVDISVVSGETASGVSFSITARPADAAAESWRTDADWALPLAALRSEIQRAGGRMSEFASEDRETVVRFALRRSADASSRSDRTG